MRRRWQVADHLRTVIDTLSPEDQAEVAGFMADPGMADPESLQLLDPVALSLTLDEMGLPRA